MEEMRCVLVDSVGSPSSRVSLLQTVRQRGMMGGKMERKESGRSAEGRNKGMNAQNPSPGCGFSPFIACSLEK